MPGVLSWLFTTKIGNFYVVDVNAASLPFIISIPVVRCLLLLSMLISVLCFYFFIALKVLLMLFPFFYADLEYHSQVCLNS